ncbi:MAG: tetratricopeptide repeat protein [Myxococcota bacterium]
MDASVEELEARLEAAGTPDARVYAQIDLAWSLRSVDSDRSHELAREARALARDLGDKLAEARAVRILSMTFPRMEDAQQVFEIAEEAMRLFDEVGDPEGRAGARDFLSSIHEFVGDYARGLELALDALAIAQEIDHPVRQGYALSSIGGILAASGEPDEAVARLREALELFSSVDDAQGIGTICSRLARVLADYDRDDEAEAFAERCLEMAESHGNDFLRATALRVRARLAEKQGELEEADRIYQAAFESFQQPLAQSIVGSEFQGLRAGVLVRLGRSEEAEQLLRRTLELVGAGDVSIVTEVAIHERLAEIREAAGDAPDALHHLRQAFDLKAKIDARDKKNRRSQIAVRTAMATAQKDAEIHRLRYVELREMQAKLIESEKMASVGKLAAGTAHELNTPVGVLRSNHQLVERASQRLLGEIEGRDDLSPSVQRLAGALDACRATSQTALDRIAAIADSYRRFAELDAAERQRFDVRDGLESALLLLEPNLPEAVHLERRLDPVPALEGWPRPLNHAFMTVLQNAVEALDGPGEIRVETLPVGQGEIHVSIADSGRGMGPEQVADLFEVGFGSQGPRTKIRLGLVAAQAAVERHGGRIEVESQPGKGTRFTFRLPTAAA